MNERGAKRSVLTQLRTLEVGLKTGATEGFSGHSRWYQIIKYIEITESAWWVWAASLAHSKTPFISARTVL